MLSPFILGDVLFIRGKEDNGGNPLRETGFAHYILSRSVSVITFINKKKCCKSIQNFMSVSHLNGYFIENYYVQIDQCAFSFLFQLMLKMFQYMTSRATLSQHVKIHL